MLHVCCWKWDTGFKNKKNIVFSYKHVNILNAMLKRHLHMDYEFCCITDDAEGIDEDVRIIPLWEEYLDAGGCFVRLKMFDRSMKEVIGDRFVSIDLDCVIVDDITPILNVDDDFRIWGEHWRKNPYCGSLWIMDAGSRQEVWDGFNISDYPPKAEGRWKRGTDQARINDCLYPDAMMWTSDDGVFNFRDDIRMDDKAKARIRVRNRGILQGRLARKKAIANAEKKAEEDMRKKCEDLGRPEKVTEAFVKRAVRRTRRKWLNKAAKEASKERKIIMDMKEKEALGHKHSEGDLPEGARIVFFNGSSSPDDPVVQEKYPWIKEHYK